MTDKEALIAAIYARTLEDDEGCFIWQGRLAANGYARSTFDGRNMAVHRRVLALSLGRPIPRNMDACHRCDKRACVRAEHLFEGTRADNMRDCAAKGRNIMQVHPERNFFATDEGRRRKSRGERHGSAKVTLADVTYIRSSTESQYVIAERLGLHQTTVGKIKNRKIWTHVP